MGKFNDLNDILEERKIFEAAQKAGDTVPDDLIEENNLKFQKFMEKYPSAKEDPFLVQESQVLPSVLDKDTGNRDIPVSSERFQKERLQIKGFGGDVSKAVQKLNEKYPDTKFVYTPAGDIYYEDKNSPNINKYIPLDPSFEFSNPNDWKNLLTDKGATELGKDILDVVPTVAAETALLPARTAGVIAAGPNLPAQMALQGTISAGREAALQGLGAATTDVGSVSPSSIALTGIMEGLIGGFFRGNSEAAYKTVLSGSKSLPEWAPESVKRTVDAASRILRETIQKRAPEGAISSGEMPISIPKMAELAAGTRYESQGQVANALGTLGPGDRAISEIGRFGKNMAEVIGRVPKEAMDVYRNMSFQEKMGLPTHSEAWTDMINRAHGLISGTTKEAQKVVSDAYKALEAQNANKTVDTTSIMKGLVSARDKIANDPAMAVIKSDDLTMLNNAISVLQRVHNAAGKVVDVPVPSRFNLDALKKVSPALASIVQTAESTANKGKTTSRLVPSPHVPLPVAMEMSSVGRDAPAADIFANNLSRGFREAMGTSSDKEALQKGMGYVKVGDFDLGAALNKMVDEAAPGKKEIDKKQVKVYNIQKMLNEPSQDPARTMEVNIPYMERFLSQIPESPERVRSDKQILDAAEIAGKKEEIAKRLELLRKYGTFMSLATQHVNANTPESTAKRLFVGYPAVQSFLYDVADTAAAAPKNKMVQVPSRLGLGATVPYYLKRSSYEDILKNDAGE